MKLVGMLDSPYVRRVAISLQALDIPFEHQSLSVFRDFDAFSSLNPVVKAPTLICDDGTVLVDSSLIIEYAEALSFPRSLLPLESTALARELRRIGLALTACEKSVQIVYEEKLRPPEHQYAPWLQRVRTQLQHAWQLLEADARRSAHDLGNSPLTQGTISVAVAWQFAQQEIPGLIAPAAHPHIAALSKEAEQLPEFIAAPHGSTRYQPASR